MRKHLLLFLIAAFSTCVAFAQGGRVITGKLLDAQTKEPLIGATVSVKGTTNATSVALDGSFKIKVPEGTTALVLSYIGYVTKEVEVTGKNLGVITLDPTAASIKEVTITANQSLAIDRQTPIAVSSVNQLYIEEKGAGAEFPELIKSTPGVMVSRTGGGYGDSRVSIRGFSSNNVALLINGLPVNDVEAGKLYWNDWAGLADVTTSMQVQRGLGASKVAAPSLGGTINITTRSIEAEKNGTISQSIGSYNDLKTTVSYATGLSDKGWASSFLLSKRTGDGNAEGLYYTGYSYFFNLSKIISKSQSLSFSIMGAAQNHGQRYSYNYINTYRTAPQGIRFNSDYGYLNGQLTSAEVNYYNKPLASLNHSWTIDDKSSLTTVAYGSYGTGGATFMAGTQYNGLVIATADHPVSNPTLRTGDKYSPIDFNAITKANLANTDGTSKTYFQTAANDHQQYGLLSTYKRALGQNINLLAGIDLRYYQGEHYYKMNNLLGGSYIVDNTDKNNANAHIIVGDRFNNNYRYDIASEGAFVQTEYVKNDLSAFITLGANNTGNQRLDYFSYLNSDPNRKTKYINFLGYQAKGGANYNLDANNNVFVNIGYLQRAPLVANIFLNKKNDINPNAIPEKLLSYELGYGFRSSIFSANVNAYRSTYKDRSVTPKSVINGDGSISTANLSGLNELHQGIEIDAKLRPIKDVTLSGQISLGDWHYTSDAGPVQVTSDNPSTAPQTISKIFIKGQKVGDAAQTTAALGLDINVLPDVKLGGNWTYYGRYNAYFDPSKITADGYTPWNVPAYSLFDVNAVYRFKFAGLDASFIANVYNLLDTKYISDAYDSNPVPLASSDVAHTNAVGVFYGIGRQYTATFKIKF